MALTPKQEITRLIARAGGLVFILLGLWEGAQPGKSILFFGVLIGFLLVLFPGAHEALIHRAVVLFRWRDLEYLADVHCPLLANVEKHPDQQAHGNTNW